MPGHWGLKGRIRDEAKIFYEIEDPYTREKALAELNITDPTTLKLKLLGIEREYNKISFYEYKMQEIDLLHTDEINNKLQKAELDLSVNKLTSTEHEKLVSTINDQPWVGVKNSNYEADKGLGGLEFELDWNEQFILFLAENGYKGINDQTVVESWFNDLCKSVVAEEGLDEYMNALDNENTSTLGILPIINKKNLDDDRSEFS